MRVVTVVALAVLLVAGPAACDDQQPAQPVDCGDVGFAPRTDDGAFDIVATGVSCERARKVAAITRDRRYSDPLSFEADGFSCVGTRVPSNELPGVDWRCTRNGRTITFIRN